MDWPGHKRQRSTLRLYRNNRNGTFTDVTRSAGLDVELYGMGVAVGDFNNDGFPDLLRHLRRPEPAVPEHRQGHVRRRHARERPRRTRGVQHVGAVVRLRSRRPARSVRLQLRQVVGRARRVLQPRRQAEVVLHARSVPRRHLLAVPQSRQRHVRGRHRDERHLRHRARNRWASRCSTTTRTAGPISFVANDTQPNKLYRNLRNGTFKDVGVERGRRVQRRTARRARAWASTPATSTTPAAPGWRSPTSTTR